MENSYSEIEALITGELDAEVAKSLMVRINSDEELKAAYLAMKASHAAFEYEIANDSRKFLGELIEQEVAMKEEKPRTKILYIAGIAATFLILILAIFSVNLSHNDIAIANQYNINTITARNAGGFTDTNFSAAVQAYFAEDYEQAASKLAEPSEEGALVLDYKDWLQLMINLKTEGSASSEFQSGLTKMLENENHEFYEQAIQLQKDLNFFWRKFVVRK